MKQATCTCTVVNGVQMFYSSPRNRPEMQVALLEKLQCTTLFTPREISETTRIVLETRKMDKFILPDLEYFLDLTPVELYPYNKTFEEACGDPYVVMHSSGTTGVPKILTLKLGSAAAHDAFQLFPKFGDAPWFVSSWTGKRVVTNFPWVHAGGPHMLSSGIYNDFVPVIPAEWPYRATDANHLHVYGNVSSAWYSPSVLVDIARNPEFLKNMSNLETVSYSGGPLPKEFAVAIAKHTHIFGSIGSTETGILPNEIPPPDMWDYYRYNERLGHTFRHYVDDLYELVHVKHKAKRPFQAVFFTLPDIDTYDMRDLYVEHPTRPGWWRSSGRIDDVIIMADAKKLHPVPYEAVIEQHPDIATALICGTGRTRPAVLVQPVKWPESEQEERQLIDTTWSYFEKSNEAGPVFGRLIKELVVVTKPDKPMARAGGKDTVQRKRSLDLYIDEINHAYENAEKLGLLFGEIAEMGNLV